MASNVVAVVVTFNRKELLVKCIDALIKQTYPLKKIFVVDNASTDGTNHYLQDNGYLNKQQIDYRRLPSNTGGAGGFASGVKFALLDKPDYVWLMDDDGWPSNNCLYNLMNSVGSVRGPLVIDAENNEATAFVYKSDDIITNDLSLLIDRKRIKPVHPFNGVLLSSDLIEEIGLPDYRFFIWGDEIDYRNRWISAGFEEVVVPEAIFYHPSDRQVIKRTSKFSIGVPINCSNLRRYCFYRNQLIIVKNKIGSIKTFGKFLFTALDVFRYESSKKIFFKAAAHAFFSVFDGHKEFIK